MTLIPAHTLSCCGTSWISKSTGQQILSSYKNPSQLETLQLTTTQSKDKIPIRVASKQPGTKSFCWTSVLPKYGGHFVFMSNDGHACTVGNRDTSHSWCVRYGGDVGGVCVCALFFFDLRNTTFATSENRRYTFFFFLSSFISVWLVAGQKEERKVCHRS